MTFNLDSLNKHFSCIRFILLLFLISSTLPISSASAAQHTKTFTVGFLLDGQSHRVEQVANLIKQETFALVENEFKLEFPKSHLKYGNWEIEKIRQQANELLQDPQVDLVVVLGIAATAVIADIQPLPKPVMALISLSTQEQLPYKAGKSGRKNLNYLRWGLQPEEFFNVMQALKPFTKLAVLLDPVHFQLHKFKDLFSAAPFKPHFITEVKHISTVLDQIPQDTEMVLVSALIQHSDEELKQLFQGLNAKKLASFSLYGVEDVTLGLLATNRPANFNKRLARRAALNLQRILLGDAPESIPVDFKLSEQLTINMSTAKEIGLPISYDLLHQAQVIQIKNIALLPPLSFIDVANQALTHNLKLKIAKLDTDIGNLDIALTKSQLLPQLQFELSRTKIDADLAAFQQGVSPEKETEAALGLSQIIFSEQALAELSIAKKIQLGREFNLEAIMLDTILEATTTFLNLMRTQLQSEIQLQNINLTRTYLKQAQLKAQLGQGRKSEEYRWKSELYDLTIELNNTKAQLRSLVADLNRILNQPINTEFNYIPPTIENLDLLISEHSLTQFINSELETEYMNQFLIQEAINRSPELQQLRHEISAKERDLKSNYRSYYVPEFSLEASRSTTISKSGAGSNDVTGLDNKHWSTGLTLSLPLFSGGSRKTQIRMVQMELQQLQLELTNTLANIKNDIITYATESNVKFTNIELSRMAAESSKNNLKLTAASYKKGAIQIIDLIDAQTSHLNAELTATTALYDFLISYQQLQRAIGAYDFMLTENEKGILMERIRIHMDSMSKS